MKYYIYTDGASRGNPGNSASGYHIYDEHYSLVKKYSFYNGKITNNAAEYIAIVTALREMLALFGSGVEIELYCDSRLVINQLAGNFKVKNEKLKELNFEAKDCLNKFKHFSLVNPRRENKYIQLVDKDLNDLLDDMEKRMLGSVK
jgi:ribonuclease HI